MHVDQPTLTYLAFCRQLSGNLRIMNCEFCFTIVAVLGGFPSFSSTTTYSGQLTLAQTLEQTRTGGLKFKIPKGKKRRMVCLHS